MRYVTIKYLQTYISACSKDCNRSSCFFERNVGRWLQAPEFFGQPRTGKLGHLSPPSWRASLTPPTVERIEQMWATRAAKLRRFFRRAQSLVAFFAGRVRAFLKSALASHGKWRQEKDKDEKKNRDMEK